MMTGGYKKLKEEAQKRDECQHRTFEPILKGSREPEEEMINRNTRVTDD